MVETSQDLGAGDLSEKRRSCFGGVGGLRDGPADDQHGCAPSDGFGSSGGAGLVVRSGRTRRPNARDDEQGVGAHDLPYGRDLLRRADKAGDARGLRELRQP